jgi:nucleotide-binding universal stress UspA family protein
MTAMLVGNEADRSRPRKPAAPRIVVGVDGSRTAQRALRWALDEARLRHAAVDVVHAWHLPYQAGYPIGVLEPPPGDLEADARALLDGAVNGTDRQGLEGVEPILVCGNAARALLDTAKNADLIVVGSRGRGGFAGLLLGSVSQKVVHHAPCPVVIIPAVTG